MSEAIETKEYKGYKIVVHVDSDPQNPRTEWDNMGHMLCYHRKYNLGDLKDRPSMEDAQKIEKRKDVICLTLGLLDHGGLYMKVGSRFESDQQGWDSGKIGIIYATFEEIRKNFNCKLITKKIRKQAIDNLTGEVETYSQYLAGEVYGYQVLNPENEQVDSCCGYYGSDFEKSGLMRDAKANADYDIEKKNKLLVLSSTNGMNI